MPACQHCGSRSVEIVLNPLTIFVHLLSNERRTRCPRCGWKGWKHKREWAHVVGAGIWRGAGGIQGPTHDEPSHSAHRVKDTPPDAVFEKAVAEKRGAPDLAAVDRALDEHDRIRAARRARRPVAQSPWPATDGPHGGSSRHEEPRVRRSRESRTRHRTSRRHRRLTRTRVILLVLGAITALVTVALMVRACA